ncbi:short chain dehydrogenase [Fibrisoma limi BUZ 3]|uniref:Short chain dehydrogenase n=1 Tax=Fibrisoma limi BUZ 3 TaxID=1185876 RepID=I2GSY9_9BACT|nr:SDR family oxidoreductase [Fibrisoma limi]CCH57018.1 short chain dehydrogenase [Fibrisoma limi BUZ 3]
MNQQEVVVVTGASAGLGRSIAHEFARHGARVALIARDQDRLEAAKKEVEDLGGQALIFPADVADADRIETIAAEVEDTWGPIDVWVNNAMVSVLSPVDQMQPDEYKRVTEVTYLGQVYGTMAALKRMETRDKGTIVLVGSALAYRGIPLQSAYCAAKHAVQGFYDSLRTELIHNKSNVKVTMVQLPAMNTPQFDWMRSRMPNKSRPMGKIYQPEVAARTIYYAAHHPDREFKVGYTSVEAILGNKVAPMIGDWVLARNGYKGQQTNEPETPGRPDNLYDTVKGDYGAHGRFNDQSHDVSAVGWLGRHQAVPIAASVVAGVVLGTLLLKR